MVTDYKINMTSKITQGCKGFLDKRRCKFFLPTVSQNVSGLLPHAATGFDIKLVCIHLPEAVHRHSRYPD